MSMYTDISHYYDYIFPLKNEKIEFVLDDINDKQQHILDIGCSTGILAKTISENGHFVKGIDLDDKMISIAKQYKNKRLNYYIMNMLDIDKYFSMNEFNQVICFGNTLVHLINQSNIFDLFIKIRKILKINGQFKFQIINYDKILDEKLEGLPTIENNKIQFIRKYKLVNGLIEFQTELLIKEENRTIVNTTKLLPIRKEEIINLLIKAGFTKIEYYSSFSMEPYNANKLPLVIKAEMM